MIGYIFVFLAVLFFCIGILIDNFLTNKKFKSTVALLFYANVTNLLFIPLLWIFGLPKQLPKDMILPLIIVAIAQITYLYPYYKAFKHADSSIITALFNLGKIFVPALAFLVVHERLSALQYVGFAIIILSSFWLTYEGGLKINMALVYMALATFILATGSTVTKYALSQIDWITVLTWAAVISTAITLVIGLLFYRKEISESKKIYYSTFWQFILNEFVTFIAIACVTYAVVSIPVTVVQGLLATSPVFMMIIISLGHKFWPKYFKENLDWKQVLKKFLFFIIMAVGIVLTVM